jgi:hypothetical protein
VLQWAVGSGIDRRIVASMVLAVAGIIVLMMVLVLLSSSSGEGHSNTD